MTGAIKQATGVDLANEASNLGKAALNPLGTAVDVYKDVSGTTAAEKAAKKQAGEMRTQAQRAEELALEQAGVMREMGQRARDQLSTGFGQYRDYMADREADAMSQLEPYLMGGQTAYGQLLNELGLGEGGATATADLPGYSSMLKAREEALADQATRFAGGGKLMSGSRMSQAADLSGAMEAGLRDKYLSQLMGLGQQGQQGATSASNLIQNFAGQVGAGQLGTSQNIAQSLMGQERDIANLLTGQQAQAAQLMGAAGQADLAAANMQRQMFGDLLGAGATAAGAYFCDKRLKENIQLIDDSGPYNVYSFNYLGSDKKSIGPMAQEIQAYNPDAVVEVDGFLAILPEAL